MWESLPVPSFRICNFAGPTVASPSRGSGGERWFHTCATLSAFSFVILIIIFQVFHHIKLFA
jgi:hypothetical protein